MIHLKNHSFKLAAAGVMAFSALTGLLAPATASAALVSGEATITIDNTAVAASNPNHWFFQTHWDPSDSALQIDGNTTGGNAIAPTGNTSLLFPVNPNTTTITTSTALYGRTLQATTMDASNTSVGQIGLNGALRMRPPSLATYLSPYDFSVSKTAGQWVIKSFDNAFSYGPMFKLANVSESVNGNGELLLNGDLTWDTSGFSWATLLGANSSTVIGTFSLAPAAVPVPAAVWMFISGMFGLLGVARRKTAVAA